MFGRRLGSRASDHKAGRSCVQEQLQDMPKCIGIGATEIDANAAGLDQHRMDNLRQFGAGLVSRVLGIEPKLEPTGQRLRRNLIKIMADFYIIPSKMLYRQRGISKHAGDRLKAQDFFRLAFYNFWGSIVPDEVGAIKPTEQSALFAQLEFHLGRSLRAACPLLLGKGAELINIVIADLRDEFGEVHALKLPTEKAGCKPAWNLRVEC